MLKNTVLICESFFENRAFDSLDFFIQQWLVMPVCITYSSK